MAQNDKERATPPGEGVFDRADLFVARDVGRHADDEQPAHGLVEHDLGRNAAVGTAEDDREGVGSSERRGGGVRVGRLLDSIKKPPVAGAEQLERRLRDEGCSL
jgi:hypothetical protein